jgi:hypothetical protein
LFPKAYNVSLGRDRSAPPSKALIFMIRPAVCSLVVTVTTAVLMNALHIDTYGAAMPFAALVGIVIVRPRLHESASAA